MPDKRNNNRNSNRSSTSYTVSRSSYDGRRSQQRPAHANAYQRPGDRRRAGQATRQPQRRPQPQQAQQPQQPPRPQPTRHGRNGRRKQNDAKPRSVGNIMFVAFLIIMSIVAIGAVGYLVTHADINPVARNNYDFSRLDHNYGHYRYTAADGTPSRLGIDVSHHNETIDWTAVAADGIEFAYVRVGWRGYTEGGIQEDSYARYNIENARANGLDVGLYFFSQAITEEEAIAEADFICDFADEYGITEYPLVFDMEENNIRNERIAGLSIEQTTDMAVTFCNRVKERGYEPMIYGNDRWLDGYFNLERISEVAELWLADYRGEPTEYYKFRMWQYSSDGTVAGVEGHCDMDLWMPEE